MGDGALQFLLIRHGQSANNARAEQDRVNDPSITDLGVLQAEQVAQRLAGWKPTRIISSPFRRALQTAWPSIQVTGVPAEVWVEVHERGGCYDGWVPSNIEGAPGLSRDEIASRFPGIEIPDSIGADGWWKSKDREADDETRSRSRGFAQRLIREFEGTSERIAFFTHADFKAIFTMQVASLRAAEISVPANCSISTFQVESNSISLLTYNDIEHLSDSMMSA